MELNLRSQILNHKAEGKKSFAVLIDPDKIDSDQELVNLIYKADEAIVDYFFVGGSLMTNTSLGHVVRTLKENCSIPVIIFPGNNLQISNSADGILFLSLISGRNAEFLIGQQVVAAPIIKKTSLEVLPTGYMLVGDRDSAASYMSNTTPIPGDQIKIAGSTALAGEMMGQQLIYLDAGSGSIEPVPKDMITYVSEIVRLPLIVGGGISDLGKLSDVCNAGADIVVVGNKIESQPEFLVEVSEYMRSWNESLKIH